MTAPRHVVPLWARRGDHRASPTCPCQPVPAADLADPHVAVYVHRFLDRARDAGHPPTRQEEPEMIDHRAVGLTVAETRDLTDADVRVASIRASLRAVRSRIGKRGDFPPPPEESDRRPSVIQAAPSCAGASR